MSTSKQRLGADMYLAALSRDLANLKAQLSELNELRERVKNELLPARKSPKLGTMHAIPRLPSAIQVRTPSARARRQRSVA
jgi:hypothetical protein